MNSQERILYILEALAKKECCSKELSRNIFGVDDSKHLRLIQNDIKIIKKIYGEKLHSSKRGCYKFISIPSTLNDIYTVSPKELLNLFEFIALFDTKMLNIFKQSNATLIKKLKKDTTAIYKIHTQPIEEIKNTQIWNTLKDAVKYRRYLSIAYHRNKLKTYNDIKPLKIVFAQNNWYLAALVSEKDNPYGFTFFRINHIIGIKVEAKTYQKDLTAMKFLENFQTLFEVYGAKKFKVELLAQKEISSFFKQKKYLESQTITKTYEDGSILLSFYVTDFMEITPLIKQWLPYLVIHSPQTLKEELKTILHQYLSKL